MNFTKKIAKKRIVTSLAILSGLCFLSLNSCDKDEEYYSQGNYTLAKKRITRSTENGYNPNTPTDAPEMYFEGGTKTCEIRYTESIYQPHFHGQQDDGTSYVQV